MEEAWEGAWEDILRMQPQQQGFLEPRLLQHQVVGEEKVEEDCLEAEPAQEEGCLEVPTKRLSHKYPGLSHQASCWRRRAV